MEEENITHHSPPLIPADLQNPQSLNFDKKRFNLFYNLWFLRKQNSFGQSMTPFNGFLTLKRSSSNDKLQKTIETYLPPINNKVTVTVTIHKILQLLHNLIGEL